MSAVLESTSYAHSGSQTNENLDWTHTLGDLGSRGLIIVGAVGKETGGEENPEEVNQILFNGVACTLLEANREQSGFAVGYLLASNIPVAGVYNVRINFHDSPKYPNAKKGFVMAFRGLKNEAPEATNSNTQASGNMTLPITSLTKNALLVGMYGHRTGNSYSFTTDQTIAVDVPNTGGENTGAVGFYKNIVVPTTDNITVNPSNSESEAIIALVFATRKEAGAQIVG